MRILFLLMFRFKNMTNNGNSKYEINAYKIEDNFDVVDYNYLLMTNGVKYNKKGIFVVSEDELLGLKEKIKNMDNVKSLQVIKN